MGCFSYEDVVESSEVQSGGVYTQPTWPVLWGMCPGGLGGKGGSCEVGIGSEAGGECRGHMW